MSARRKALFVSLILFILWSISAFANEGGKESEVKIYIKDYHDIVALTKMRIELDFRGTDFVTAIVNEHQLDRIRAANFKIEILIEDLKAHARSLIESGELAAYYDPVALGAFLDSMATFYPDITQLDTLGYSIQIRPLFSLKISDNANIDENEPEVHFDGLHHGDEKICVEVCVFMIRYLCENYGSNPQVTNIVNNREVLFFPMMNPDGHILHQRYNAAGVDLNRDWGYMWDGWGGSPAPFSQPETKALRKFVLSNQSAIATTYHSGTQYISYPWSYQANPAPDKMPIDHLAAGYSSTSGYPYGQGCTGMYPINGSAKDSYYGILGAVGWTVEISYQKTPPVSQIPYYCNLNRDAMLYLMEQAGEGLCGVVTDSITGIPLAAIVEVEGLWPVYTDPVIGDYHKFVLPGVYNLKVWANGYKTKTAQNVFVSSGGATQINMELAPEDGTYAYRVVSCLVADPNSVYTNTSWTHYALGKQDGRPLSMGVNGWIVLDMGSGTPIIERPGPDFTVYEGDGSPEGYYVYVGNNWAGPWQYIGNGIGTTGFDFATTGFSQVRYVRIVDDGDGNPNAGDAGFELDAIDGTYTGEGWDIAGNINYHSNDEPVENAIVVANHFYSDTTSTNGTYTLLNLPSANYIVRPEKEHDSGDAISAYDAALILQYGVGLISFTPYQMIAADVSGNGEVSAYDAAKILQYGVGLIDRFPVMEDSSHFWRFVPEDFAITLSNWINAPDSIAYTPLNSDTTDNYYGIIYGDVSGNWHPSSVALASLGKSSERTVNIRLEDIHGEAGDKVVLPVILDNGSDIVAMSFNLEYDARVLKALSASTTEKSEDWQIAYNIKGDFIKVALAGSRPIIASGIIINLEFEVLETDLSAGYVPLNISELMINEGNISVNVQAAEFNSGSPVLKEYVLSQNYPNPFNSQTMIKYQLPQPGRVVLKIYNTLGQEVRTLVDEQKKAGYYRISWDGNNNEGSRVSSGIYVFRFQVGAYVKVRKMLFLM